MNEQKIYFRRVRGFGEIFGAAFAYIRQNFKSFFGSIILFTLPFIALITVLLVNIVSRATAGIGAFDQWSSMQIVFMIVGVISLLLMLMQAVFVTVINRHLLLSEELGNDARVQVADVGNGFMPSFWRVLGNALLLTLVAIVFVIIYALFNAFLNMAFSTIGMAGALFAALLQMLVSFMLSPIFAFYGVSTLFVVQKNKVNAFTALGIVTRYLRGNFWSTWAVSFVGYLMTYISSAIVAVPIILISVFGLISRFKYSSGASDVSFTTLLIGAVIFVATMLLFLCIYSVYLLICTFQYTNLEEKQEGHTIIDKINQIS